VTHTATAANAATDYQERNRDIPEQGRRLRATPGLEDANRDRTYTRWSVVYGRAAALSETKCSFCGKKGAGQDAKTARHVYSANGKMEIT